MAKLNTDEIIQKIAQKTKEYHYTKVENDAQLQGKQDVIDNNNKLSANYIEENETRKFVTLQEKTQITTNKASIVDLQTQIDALNAAQNLADIVADLTALSNLDTSKLQPNDKIEVLRDGNHDNVSTVYNWNGTTPPTQGQEYIQVGDGYFIFIGEYGTDSYTKAQMNALLDEKQDTLSGSESVDITSNVVSVKQSFVDSQFLTDSEMNDLIEEVYGSEYTL